MDFKKLVKGLELEMKNVGRVKVISVAKHYIKVADESTTYKMQFACENAPISDAGLSIIHGFIVVSKPNTPNERALFNVKGLSKTRVYRNGTENNSDPGGDFILKVFKVEKYAQEMADGINEAYGDDFAVIPYIPAKT